MYESFKNTELLEEKNESLRNTEPPEGNNTVVFFSWQLCNQGSVGMKISFFLVVIMA